MKFPLYIAKRYFSPKNQIKYLSISLAFILLCICFIGLVYSEAILVYNSLTLPNDETIKVIITILITTLSIAYVYLFVLLFRKYYKSVFLRILFGFLGIISVIGIPVFMVIILYKLFIKKIPQIINLMSAISVIGVSFGTMGLVIILSVFNGFDDLIRSLFNAFDPDLKVTLVEGKHFAIDETLLDKLSEIKGVAAYSKVLEENAILKYGEKQFIATVKGVDEEYQDVNGMDSMIVDGAFNLEDKHQPYAIVGQGIAYYLQIGLKFINPVIVYVPLKNATNPQNAFNQKYIFPSGIFAVEQEHDAKYMIAPISFLHELLEDSTISSAIEIKMEKNVDQKQVQNEVQLLFGNKFIVKTRLQQNELFYRIMKYEKWTIFMILSFILMVASFNIVGSLSMLIIEKKKDISTFQSVGANRKLIGRIFLLEGMMISFLGALLGLFLGLLICWLQIKYGFVKLQGSGSFIIDAYPVSIRIPDIIFVFFTVLVIGYLAAWYPVRFIIKKYLPENQFIFY